MWIITKDHDFEENGGDKSAVGTMSIDFNESKEASLTSEFRMFDGDNVLIYSGKATPGSDFQPLDDFGEPHFGCTGIQYKDSKGRWDWL